MEHELAIVAEQHRHLLDAEFVRYRDEVAANLTAGRAMLPLTTRSGGSDDLWLRLATATVEELHYLFCTDDARYKDVRKRGSDFAKIALPSVAGYIAGTLGISLALATGAVALMAISVFRVGVGVFCRVARTSAASALKL